MDENSHLHLRLVEQRPTVPAHPGGLLAQGQGQQGEEQQAPAGHKGHGWCGGTGVGEGRS